MGRAKAVHLVGQGDGEGLGGVMLGRARPRVRRGNGKEERQAVRKVLGLGWVLLVAVCGAGVEEVLVGRWSLGEMGVWDGALLVMLMVLFICGVWCVGRKVVM